MRVAIANDSPRVTETLRRLVEGVPGYEVVWTAADGAEAVRRCAAERPDLVLMDLAMPVLDGVEATRRIMKETPATILLVTASVGSSTARIFEAMGFGALDAVQAPRERPDGTVEGGEAFLAKVALLARLSGSFEAEKGPRKRTSRLARAIPPLVVLGASTGGPRALVELLGALPADLGAALVVIQHVDAPFAQGLAGWLSTQTKLPVALAAAGDHPRKGQVLLAATDDHLVLGADLAVAYTPEPRDCPYRPSVDAFLLSAARLWPEPGIAVLLTGMGRDGAQGLLACRSAGWHTIAQDEKSSVLYGMPKAARELGAAVEVLPLEEIPAAVTRRVHDRSGSAPRGTAKEPPR